MNDGWLSLTAVFALVFAVLVEVNVVKGLVKKAYEDLSDEIERLREEGRQGVEKGHDDGAE